MRPLSPKSIEGADSSCASFPDDARAAAHLAKAETLREERRSANAKEFWVRDVTLSYILDFAYVFDRSGRFLYANKPLLDLWGLTLTEAVGKNFFDLNYPADLATKLQRQIQQVFDTGTAVSDETPYTSPSGRPGYYEYIFTPVFAKDGTVEAVAGSTRDITRRKRVEQNLAFLASLSHDLARLARVDELMQTIGAKIGAYLNLSLCTFVEINENEDEAVVNHDWHRDDVPSLVGSYRLAEYLTDDFQKAGRAGESFVVRDTKSDPRTDSNRYDELKIKSFVCVPLVRQGKWRFMLCIHHSEACDWLDDEIELIREVTSRVWLRLEAVRAENALVRSIAASEKQRRLYDAILSSSPDLVYVFDLNHRFTYANEALLKMWGRTWDDAIGKNCLELGYEPWHAAMHDREIDQVVATKKPIRGEVPFNGTNGRRIYDYIFVPVLDSKGEVEAISGTTRDVTERKRAEADLEEIVLQRTAKLQETIMELEAFSYSISHDMRSPLRAMQGYSDALLTEHTANLDQEAVHYLQRINRGANRLELLVRDVLAYSKVARGDLQLKRINVEKLILDVLQSYNRLDASRLRVQVKPLTDVMGHESLLTQVISNLLTNAVKFAQAGVFPEVTISGEIVEDRVVISFRDNGIGIAAKDHVEIFKIFGRVYPDKQYEGTGIGLAVVKKACERMGGSVGVESELGKGSRFWISLVKAL